MTYDIDNPIGTIHPVERYKPGEDVWVLDFRNQWQEGKVLNDWTHGLTSLKNAVIGNKYDVEIVTAEASYKQGLSWWRLRPRGSCHEKPAAL